VLNSLLAISPFPGDNNVHISHTQIRFKMPRLSHFWGHLLYKLNDQSFPILSSNEMAGD